MQTARRTGRVTAGCLSIICACVLALAPLQQRALAQAQRPWPQAITSWAQDSLWPIYAGFDAQCGNTQVTSVIAALNAMPAQKSHNNAMVARAAMAVAEMHAYAYIRGLSARPACSFAAVQTILSAALNVYDRWGRVWLSTTPSNELLITSRMVWRELPQPLQTQILDRMTSEADFWVDQYQRVRMAPNGFDVDDAIIGTPPEPTSPNWMLLGSINGNTRYLGDTKAEENAMTALFLAHAYVFVSERGNATWASISRCFLFYSVTVGETPGASQCASAIPVALRTVTNNLQLSNHAVDSNSPYWNVPNPQYAEVTLYHIAMAQALLDYGGLQWHNLDTPARMLGSTFWATNMTACGYDSAEYVVPAGCAPGTAVYHHIQAMLSMLFWVREPGVSPDIDAALQRLVGYHDGLDANGARRINNLFLTATPADTDPLKILGQIERLFYPVVRNQWAGNPAFLQSRVPLQPRVRLPLVTGGTLASAGVAAGAEHQP